MYPMEWTLKKECLPIGYIFVYNKYKESRFCMSKVLFTDSEVKKLRKNKYVKSV